MSREARDYVSTAVVLAREQDAALRELALSEHTSVSDLVRRAVGAYLRTAYPAEQVAAIRDRARLTEQDGGE